MLPMLTRSSTLHLFGGLPAWLVLGSFSVLACAGCGGGAAGEAVTSPQPAEVGEGGEPHGDETPACDEAAITLVGRYSLTHYPGQDAVGPNGERPLGMSKDYDFGADSYTMEGYPPLRITGRYEVLERDGARMRVRFYDTVFDGSADADRELWLVFSDCGATLQMDGMTYARRVAE